MEQRAEGERRDGGTETERERDKKRKRETVSETDREVKEGAIAGDKDRRRKQKA